MLDIAKLTFTTSVIVLRLKVVHVDHIGQEIRKRKKYREKNTAATK